MAHPYHHAVSSARLFGGIPQDYQAIHDWFDASKAVYGDFRHRALRHHSEGVALAIHVFGREVTNTAGGTVCVSAIGEQHLVEDCGRVVSAGDWFNTITRPGVSPRMVLTVDEQCKKSALRFGGSHDDYRAMHEFMDYGLDVFSRGGFAFRHHSWGVFELELRFGRVVRLSTGRILPVRFVGEQHVSAEFGSVVSVEPVLRRISGQAWMLKAAGVAARKIADFQEVQ